MLKIRKITAIILLQMLVWGNCANAVQMDGDRQEVSCLSPQIYFNGAEFQGRYALFLEEAKDFSKSAALGHEINPWELFKQAENLLFEFGGSPAAQRDIFRQDIYDASERLIRSLYKNQFLAKKYISFSRRGLANEKIKILHIAFLLQIVRITKFYQPDIINQVIDKVMLQARIKPARSDFASASFSYHVDQRIPQWYCFLCVSIVHELAHNIKNFYLPSLVKYGEDNEADSISEFFADLVPYIVFIELGFTDIYAILKQKSLSLFIKTQKGNNGYAVNPHIASQAQLNKLFRGVSIREQQTQDNMKSIFRRALLPKNQQEMKFNIWVYNVNGIASGFPADSKTVAGSIKLAELSLRDTVMLADNWDMVSDDNRSAEGKEGVPEELTAIEKGYQNGSFVQRIMLRGARVISMLDAEEMRKAAFSSYYLVSREKPFGRLTGARTPPDEMGYYTWTTSLLMFQNDFSSAGYTCDIIRDILERVRRNPRQMVTLVDWGCGTGKLLNNIAAKLKDVLPDFKNHVRLIGFANMYLKEWEKSDSSVIFILDTADNFPRYFSKEEIDIVISYMGIFHLEPDQYKEQMEAMFPLLHHNALVIHDYAFSEFKRVRIKEFLENKFTILDDNHNFSMSRLVLKPHRRLINISPPLEPKKAILADCAITLDQSI